MDCPQSLGLPDPQILKGLSPKFYHFLLLPLSINRLMIPMVVVVKWDIIVEVFAPFCVEMIYIWAFTT